MILYCEAHRQLTPFERAVMGRLQQFVKNHAQYRLSMSGNRNTHFGMALGRYRMIGVSQLSIRASAEIVGAVQATWQRHVGSPHGATETSYYTLVRDEGRYFITIGEQPLVIPIENIPSEEYDVNPQVYQLALVPGTKIESDDLDDITAYLEETRRRTKGQVVSVGGIRFKLHRKWMGSKNIRRSQAAKRAARKYRTRRRLARRRFLRSARGRRLIRAMHMLAQRRRRRR